MKIKLTSVYVPDLQKARKFYTETLGFMVKREIPMGNTWFVTVVSPEEPNGTELLLEPNGEHQATKEFKQALVNEGIPLAAFQVDDIQKEFERLKSLGVKFKREPGLVGPVMEAVFDDTCGNLIQIYQV